VMTCPRLLTFTNVYSAMLGIGTFCTQHICKAQRRERGRPCDQFTQSDDDRGWLSADGVLSTAVPRSSVCSGWQGSHLRMKHGHRGWEMCIAAG